jgi:predicted nucleic acid-binding protein
VVSTLVETNVLLRQFEPAHAQYRAAVDGTLRLIESGEPVHVAAQNVTEFWAVATRPRQANGLGLDAITAEAAIETIERTFALLPDDPAIHRHWKRLVAQHRVIGRRVFDIRIVAVMLVHGVERILTFNADDFAGYGVEVIDPAAAT